MAQRTGGRGRAAIFLFVSAIAALAACGIIWLVFHNLQQELAVAQAPPPTVTVVAAKRTLYQGQTLTSEDLEQREVEPDYVPPTAYRTVDELIGRVPQERILQGEYIRAERLASSGAGVGLNAIIPRGQRARSINITDGSAVSGFLNPGNYVDVLVTIKPDREAKGSGGSKAKDDDYRTITLLQNVKILAVDSRLGAGDAESETGRDGNTYRPSVTLAVTPEEAERITHAQVEGDVTLTLRNDIDSTQVDTNGARAEKILGKPDQVVITFKDVKTKPRPRVEEEMRSLSVIKGQKVEVKKQKVPAPR